MALTLNQAAKTCGRSKSTLLNAIRSGRISAPKDDLGRYVIDPAELHRAFPGTATDHPWDYPTTPADRGLEREVELLREMLAKAEATADHWRALAERQQTLLEDKRPRESSGSFDASLDDRSVCGVMPQDLRA